jgi:hypothetical protein
MTYQEMLYELEMCGFAQGTLRCFSLAHEGGASDEELFALYEDLMCD